MKALDQKIDHLPTNPGVYLFKDKKGTILWVCKAGDIQVRNGRISDQEHCGPKQEK
jgi:excinuclease UvrABC nuclease subunit